MNADQLAALRAEVIAHPGCAEAYAAKDCQVIAEIISPGRTRLEKTFIGVGTILSTLGGDRGAAVLDIIQQLVASKPVVKYAWMLLDRGALDMGDQETHDQMDKMAQAGVMTQAEADKLKNLGRRPHPYTTDEVAAALYEIDGTQK